MVDVVEERTESLQMESDLNDLSRSWKDAGSLIENIKRKRHSAETALRKENKKLTAELKRVANDNLRQTEEKYRLKIELERMQMSLRQLTEDKIKLELTLQAELRQAHLDRQNLDRELQNITIAKGKVEGELVTMREDQKLLNSALETIQKNLADEKDSKLCKICLELPKDTTCFPCLHVDYCFPCLEKHRQNSRTCPTCRTILSGVLRSDIGV